MISKEIVNEQMIRIKKTTTSVVILFIEVFCAKLTLNKQISKAICGFSID